MRNSRMLRETLGVTVSPPLYVVTSPAVRTTQKDAEKVKSFQIFIPLFTAVLRFSKIPLLLITKFNLKLFPVSV